MYIRKQRLLTPGPTPLLPAALHAMMGSDIHHRTEDFRKLYKQVLADLKEVMGTSNDVLVLVASGSGGLEAATQNFFSPGDEVLVCSAGKFGERWVEHHEGVGHESYRADGPLWRRREAGSCGSRFAAEQEYSRSLCTGFRDIDRRSTRRQAMGLAVKKTDAIFVVDAITGLGTMPLDIDGWGLDVVVGGSQKAFMIPPGLAFHRDQPQSVGVCRDLEGTTFLFRLRKEKKNAANGESAWTPNTALLLALGGGIEVH